MSKEIIINNAQRLVKLGSLDIIIMKDLPICEFSIDDKMTKRFFTIKGCRDKECLELVHIDLCKPFYVHIQRGYEYWVYLHNAYEIQMPWINL